MPKNTRAALNPEDHRLIEALQRLRQEAGWTVADEAAALSVPVETLKGVLFGKNRAGPRLLGIIFDFARMAWGEERAEAPPVLRELHLAASALLSGFRSQLVDGLWRGVRRDFDSKDSLLRFLRVEPSEWDRFAAGEDPSSTLLRAIALAYQGEGQRVQDENPTDARWYKEITVIAERLLALG